MDRVSMALAGFSGTHEDVSLLFRLVLHETAHLPSDHALRGEIDVFYSDVRLMALSLRLGGDVVSVRGHLTKAWAGIAGKSDVARH